MAFNWKAVGAWFINPHNLVYVLFAVTVLLLSTGVLAQSGNVYGSRSAQSASPVLRAVILQTREVKVAAADTTRYAGTAAGGALGGGLGFALGKKGKSSTALGVVGAVLGGLGGATAADHLGGSRAVEYVVQIPATPGRSEQLMAITQPEPGQLLLPGETVYLVNTMGAWRVIRANLPAPQVQETEPAGGWVRPVPNFHTEVQFDARS